MPSRSLLFLINLVRSLRMGEVATGNIWQSRSPEWQVPSPAPMHNYLVPLRVVGDPYDYGESEPYVVIGDSLPALSSAPVTPAQTGAPAQSGD